MSTEASMVSAMSLSGTAGSTPRMVPMWPSGREVSKALTGVERSNHSHMTPAKDSSLEASAAMMLRCRLIRTSRAPGKEHRRSYNLPSPRPGEKETSGGAGRAPWNTWSVSKPLCSWPCVGPGSNPFHQDDSGYLLHERRAPSALCEVDHDELAPPQPSYWGFWRSVGVTEDNLAEVKENATLFEALREQKQAHLVIYKLTKASMREQHSILTTMRLSTRFQYELNTFQTIEFLTISQL
ncbi:hypothetical protein V5799_024020 [Amblyomma americanum]|uniref:Uncharacterized protein n=1 Tax=Amblyomma americanum TaxID=6943 RepID=A0AAQ4EDL0_AMBAM